MIEQSIDVYVSFTRPKGWFKPLSWLIRIFDGLPKSPAPYSHVVLEWKCPVLREEMAYHASGSNVHLVNKRLFDKNIKRIKQYKLELSPDRVLEHGKFIFKYAGTSYSKRQIFGIFLVKIGLFSSNPFTDGRRSQVCSEVIGTWLEEVMDIEVGGDLDSTGPAMIDRFLAGIDESTIV